MKLTLTVALCVLCSGLSLAQTAPGKSELDRASIQPDVQRLTDVVNEAVTSAGGDLDRTQAHWVIAFSTGHYKADPLGAQAARELATQFIRANAIAGDRVTGRAWEMNLWEYRNPTGLTLQIGTDAAADKARVSNIWPTTPAVGSVGGHDTERAAVALQKEFGNDASTILIMLTNTAASVGGAGSKLLGTNAPAYQALLKDWTRVSGTQDGATVNLPYVVKTPTGDVQSQMQAVVFVPKTFTGAGLTDGTRTAQLQAPETPAKPEPKSGGGNAGLFVLALLGLGALGAVAWKFLGGSGGGGKGSLRVGDTSFSLKELPNGRPFCVIAGPGFTPEDDLPVIPVQGLPATRVAELSKAGKEIKVRGVSEDIQLSSVAGRVVVGSTATIPLRLDQPDAPLEFSGEVKGPGGVPREITRTVNVSYMQGEL